MAAATGYAIVGSEFSMSTYSAEGSEALAAARAGMHRFVAEHTGQLPDSASYAIGDAVVTVTPRVVQVVDASTQMVDLRSVAEVADPRRPTSPARRTVSAQAIYHVRPMPLYAAAMISAASLIVTGDAYGADHNTSLDCVGGGTASIGGAIGRVTVSGDAVGSPNAAVWSGGATALFDSIRVRFDLLSDPSFPVDYENSLPAAGSIPADSFPIVRFTDATVTISTSTAHNRGVLIVPNTLRPWAQFDWEGIVLAGHVADPQPALPPGGSVDGVIVGGLAANNVPSTLDLSSSVRYHSCHVNAANESLAYLELLENSVVELR